MSFLPFKSAENNSIRAVTAKPIPNSELRSTSKKYTMAAIIAVGSEVSRIKPVCLHIGCLIRANISLRMATNTAASVAICRLKVYERSFGIPIIRYASKRCPLLETGRNSVAPWTIPNIMHCKIFI